MSVASELARSVLLCQDGVYEADRSVITILSIAAKEMQDLETTVNDYKETFKDHQRLVREIDVIINGEDGAAPQASLCDIVGQIRQLTFDVKDLARGLKKAKELIDEIGKELFK